MDATDVAQVGRVLLVMDMLLNLSEFLFHSLGSECALSAWCSIIQW
jgi:hypothetical protein